MERADLALGSKAPRLKDGAQMLRTAAQSFVLFEKCLDRLFMFISVIFGQVKLYFSELIYIFLNKHCEPNCKCNSHQFLTAASAPSGIRPPWAVYHFSFRS